MIQKEGEFMSILFIFSGQGYKEPGIFNLFRDTPHACEFLKEFDIDSMKPNTNYFDPEQVQLTIGAYQLTLFSHLKPLFEHHQIELAGYSLGEVNAFLASIGTDPKESMRVLAYRTHLMSAISTKSSQALSTAKAEAFDLLSIKGAFNLNELQSLCNGYDCAIAIINANDHIIVGGQTGSLKLLQAKLAECGLYHTRFLEIQRPSHTPFYQDKKGQFAQFINEHIESSGTLKYPIISPLALQKIYQVEDEITLLDEALYSTLQWQKLCELIAEYRYELIIDLGPGDAMSNLLLSNCSEYRTPIITVSHYKGLEGVIRAILAGFS